MATVLELDRLMRDAGPATDQMDLNWIADGQSGVYRYEIGMPMSENYSRVSAFAAKVVEVMPHVGIQSLTLQRTRIGDTRVEAQLRFVAYFRD